MVYSHSRDDMAESQGTEGMAESRLEFYKRWHG